ncbi:MAG: uracil-DNA glycosylase [Candidatus Latescibacteria bacterium]|nr:uracil-DNA glycosylase [Candidatus Latescibacterota bacterium]
MWYVKACRILAVMEIEMLDSSQANLFEPLDPIMTSETLDELHSLVMECTRCPDLAEYRRLAVPGVGPVGACVFFIGAAPARWEDQQGEPFVGAAGVYLNELLQEIGLERSRVFITNVVKCRPPDDRDLRASEIRSCAPYLERQLVLVNPDLVVLLGRVALEWFFPEDKITEVAGELRRKVIGSREFSFLPLLHPALGLRREDMKVEIERQFQRIREVLDEL